MARHFIVVDPNVAKVFYKVPKNSHNKFLNSPPKKWCPPPPGPSQTPFLAYCHFNPRRLGRYNGMLAVREKGAFLGPIRNMIIIVTSTLEPIYNSHVQLKIFAISVLLNRRSTRIESAQSENAHPPD